MQFLHPWFLAALGSLAIPIIIHLFYFRRFKKVYFSSVRFLKEVKDETSARSKLKNLLVLISRLLAIAFLVMAFAQPYKSNKVQEKFSKNQVGIFVDNSYSMNALSEETPLLSLAKQRARTIVESYDVQDQFMVLTHDFEGKHFRLLPQEEALSLIDEITATASVHDLSEALPRIKNTISKNEGNKHIYFISDFQQSITDLPNIKDTLFKVNLIPLQSVQEKNISIDSAWFESPTQWIDRPNLLKFKVTNYGDQPIQDARLSITQNKQTKPLGLVSLSAGESKIDTAQVILNQPGWQELQLEITDFPIQFDDKLNLAFHVNPKTNILIISNGEANENLQTAIRSLPAVNLQLTQVNNINYTSLAQNQLIILNDLLSVSSGLSNELLNAVNQGTNILLFPSQVADLNTYNQLLTILQAGTYSTFDKKTFTASSINTNEFVFNDVFTRVTNNMRLPTVQGRYNKTKSAKGEESILSFSDGKDFISKVKTENGAIYICSSPLNNEWSDLSKNAEIFVPMIYRMSLNKNKNEKLALFIGQDESLELKVQKKSPEDIVHFINTKKEDIIPQQRSLGNKVLFSIPGSIKTADIYKATLRDSIIALLPFNFNRKESNLKIYTLENLQDMYPDLNIINATSQSAFASWFADNQKGVSYWKWFIAFTLLFLLIESLLLRFWK